MNHDNAQEMMAFLQSTMPARAGEFILHLSRSTQQSVMAAAAQVCSYWAALGLAKKQGSPLAAPYETLRAHLMRLFLDKDWKKIARLENKALKAARDIAASVCAYAASVCFAYVAFVCRL